MKINYKYRGATGKTPEDLVAEGYSYYPDSWIRIALSLPRTVPPTPFDESLLPQEWDPRSRDPLTGKPTRILNNDPELVASVQLLPELVDEMYELLAKYPRIPSEDVREAEDYLDPQDKPVNRYLKYLDNVHADEYTDPASPLYDPDVYPMPNTRSPNSLEDRIYLRRALDTITLTTSNIVRNNKWNVAFYTLLLTGGFTTRAYYESAKRPLPSLKRQVIAGDVGAAKGGTSALNNAPGTPEYGDQHVEGWLAGFANGFKGVRFDQLLANQIWNKSACLRVGGTAPDVVGYNESLQQGIVFNGILGPLETSADPLHDGLGAMHLKGDPTYKFWVITDKVFTTNSDSVQAFDISQVPAELGSRADLEAALKSGAVPSFTADEIAAMQANGLKEVDFGRPMAMLVTQRGMSVVPSQKSLIPAEMLVTDGVPLVPPSTLNANPADFRIQNTLFPKAQFPSGPPRSARFAVNVVGEKYGLNQNAASYVALSDPNSAGRFLSLETPSGDHTSAGPTLWTSRPTASVAPFSWANVNTNSVGKATRDIGAC